MSVIGSIKSRSSGEGRPYPVRANVGSGTPEPQPAARPPSRERAFDPNRLRRGAVRAVEKLGPHQYRVEGRHQKFYDVNLEADGVPCDCADAFYRGRGCLHELAARLHDGDGPLIQSLGDILLRQEKHLELMLRESVERGRRKLKLLK
jgi:hypothetical protein